MLINIVFSACGNGNNVAPTSGATPCPPESNPYATPISDSLVALYEKAITASGDSTAYSNVQLEVFNKLVNDVYYLSDSVDMHSGEKTIRITITYISPELLHTIIVNHYLYKRFFNFSGKLKEQIPVHLSMMVGRNEYAFFITFTASAYTDNPKITFDFPLKELKLTNTNNATFIPAHDDYNLEKTIDLTSSPQYGFFYYPMAVVQNGSCQMVLHKNYDTNVVLNIPSIIISDKDMGLQSWDYKLAALIDMTNVSGVHQNKFSLPLLIDQFSPKTSIFTASIIESPEFWAALARIIWLETTLDP